jgi:GNAT superfamily N-acetyltransferase
MKYRTPLGYARHLVRKLLRLAFRLLPRAQRFAIYRSFVECEADPDARLQLSIAHTREELEACFKLLHDAYVDTGFMKPDPSGMRVTIYHALPTTTILCAKFDGEVVGTLSLIRDSAFGFPLQSAFDLAKVRARQGNIAEVSALAIHPKFRRTGGAILFPLMKFMYEYCTTFFDTRHLIIAVNPNRIEMYESLLLFRRLSAQTVENYDFANGAPAVGAWLDLRHAPERFEEVYGNKPLYRNLHHYFTIHKLDNIRLPVRRYYVTNDPILTPALINHFFNVRTGCFSRLDPHQVALLHSLYEHPAYRAVLPAPTTVRPNGLHGRGMPRYTIKCPGHVLVPAKDDAPRCNLKVIDASVLGFRARVESRLPTRQWLEARIRLGKNEVSIIKVRVVHVYDEKRRYEYGFELGIPDLAWLKFVGALISGQTRGDLDDATQFIVGAIKKSGKVRHPLKELANAKR